jgi:CPW-WPC domain-containing protein
MAFMRLFFALGSVALAQMAHAQRTPLDSIGGIMRSAGVDSVLDTARFDSYSSLIRGLSRVPPPPGLRKSRVDPISPYGAAACHRDYNATCPQEFVILGQTSQCVASPRYAGPCGSEAYAFASWSGKAKARWSDQCLAKWPCIKCDRDYRGCPVGWDVGNVRDLSCSPPSSYAGPCKGVIVFAGYNKDMLSQWSSECGAFWPCDLGAASIGEDANPIAKDVNLARFTSGVP